MKSPPSLQYIPLAQLRMSPLNARKTITGDVEDLAASIAAHGLLQNLSVVDAGAAFEVVAGGRRLSAMQILHSQARLPTDLIERVPCLVIDDAVAHEASTAENTVRVQMHPADQFDAFQRMADEGKPIADIAAHFGVSDLVVRGRLKLANVAPEIVADYRAGKATLEQMMALAITDDQDAQRAAWNVSDAWDRKPNALRDALTAKEVRSSDKRVRLIGIEAYEAAGGAVRRDLFATNGTCWLLDEPLLNRLVGERLQAEHDALIAEGWSFVHIISNDPWKFTNACKHSRPTVTPRVLTDEQKLQLEQASARRDAITDQIERIEEETNDVIDDGHPLAAEFDAVEATVNSLTSPIESYTDRQKFKAGCVIHLGIDGTLEITRGLTPEGQKAENEVAVAQGKPAEKLPPTLSVDMQTRLRLHQAAAARVMIARSPMTALRMLITQLVSNLVSHGYAAIPFNVRVSNEHESDAQKFDEVANSKASAELRDSLDAFKTMGMPKNAIDVHTWLEGRLTEDHIQLLAVLLALTMEQHAGEKIAQYFDVDMAYWWQPTADTYLTLVPKSLLAEAVAEVAGQPAGDAITAMKKDAAIANAAEHLDGTGWLPKPLRGPGYRPRTKLTAESVPPATKSAKHKKGKKSVKKRKPTTG